MNVAAHQENEKTSKREAGEEKKRATDFKRAARYLSAVVQRTTRRKNGLCEGSAQGNWDPWESQQHFEPTQMGLETAPPR